MSLEIPLYLEIIKTSSYFYLVEPFIAASYISAFNFLGNNYMCSVRERFILSGFFTCGYPLTQASHAPLVICWVSNLSGHIHTGLFLESLLCPIGLPHLVPTPHSVNCCNFTTDLAEQKASSVERAHTPGG